MALVYIGIPTFNRPDWVQEAVASVLAQSVSDVRVVVSDNCSTGDTAERISRYVAGLGDPRVSFHQQSVNGGEYGQGRFFLDHSEGAELFMILHDDDALLPDCLAEGVAALQRHPDAAFFVANAHAMEPDGRRSEAQTVEHARFLGRSGVAEGLFDVLGRHLASGFAPISGTLFRREALLRSGFVDADCGGNYPFECNVFLRLGEMGSKAWFSPKVLMGVRYHPGALRSQRLLEDPALVSTAIRIFSRRRFRGTAERRRRAILARYYRADAAIAARGGRVAEARAALARAIRTWPVSPKTWLLLPVLMLAPRRLLRTGLAGA